MTTTNTKKKLVWRLSKAPTLEDVTTMLEKGIVTKEEAKELLFNLTNDNDKIKALEEQVEFLQGVVDKLSNREPAQIIYKYVHDWTPSYAPRREYWLGSGGISLTGSNNTNVSDFMGTTKLINNISTALASYSDSGEKILN